MYIGNEYSNLADIISMNVRDLRILLIGIEYINF